MRQMLTYKNLTIAYHTSLFSYFCKSEWNVIHGHSLLWNSSLKDVVISIEWLLLWSSQSENEQFKTVYTCGHFHYRTVLWSLLMRGKSKTALYITSIKQLCLILGQSWVVLTDNLQLKRTGPESRYYRDCAVPYVRHFHMGYSIFHCDSMKNNLLLHWITMEYAMSRMKMPHIRDCTISVQGESGKSVTFWVIFYEK